MPEYRKKSVVVEARQWDGAVENATKLIDWMLSYGGTARYHDEPSALSINVIGGIANAVPGDYIVRGVQNEFYPCTEEIFHATYEPVPPRGCRCEEILAEGGDWVDCPIHAEVGEPFVSVDDA